MDIDKFVPILGTPLDMSRFGSLMDIDKFVHTVSRLGTSLAFRFSDG